MDHYKIFTLLTYSGLLYFQLYLYDILIEQVNFVVLLSYINLCIGSYILFNIIGESNYSSKKYSNDFFQLTIVLLPFNIQIAFFNVLFKDYFNRFLFILLINIFIYLFIICKNILLPMSLIQTICFMFYSSLYITYFYYLEGNDYIIQSFYENYSIFILTFIVILLAKISPWLNFLVYYYVCHIFMIWDQTILVRYIFMITMGIISVIQFEMINWK